MVSYLLDGVEVTDPFSNSLGITLDKGAISQISLTPGWFPAEYGGAMSGIVNITTKEGTERYRGTIEYGSDGMLKDGANRLDYNRVRFNLGGPLPTAFKSSFFLSGNLWNAANWSPGIVPKPHNDKDQKDILAKLSFNPLRNLRFTIGGNWAYERYHLYNHQRSRGKWLREGPLYENGNSLVYLSLAHSLSQNISYTLNLSRHNIYSRHSSQDGRSYRDFRAVGPGLKWMNDPIKNGWYDQEWGTWLEGMNPDSIWLDYYKENLYYRQDSDGVWRWISPELHAEALNDRRFDTGQWVVDYSAPDSVRYVPFDLDAYLEDVANSPNHQSDLYQGNIDRWAYPYPRDEYQQFIYNFYPRWHDRNGTSYTGKFNLTVQVNKHNRVKAGFYWRKSLLEHTDIQFLNARPYSDHYTKEPINAAAYLQDEVRYEKLLMNLGLRFDYFNPKSKRYINIHNFDLGKEDTPTSYRSSPRLGLLYYGDDKTLFWVNYGWFYQHSGLHDLYRDLNSDVTLEGVVLGDPGIAQEKTAAYEAGLKHDFTPDVRGEIIAYYKDIPMLLSSEQVDTYLYGMPVQYTIITTNDFATIKGIDISLSRRRGVFTGRLTYSYMSATGTGSGGKGFYYYYMVEGEPRPRVEYPLESDIAHTVKASVNMYLREGYGPTFLGIKPLSDLNVNLQFIFMSGAPYTPQGAGGRPLSPGSARLPSTHQTDMKIVKNFRVAGGLKYGLFLDVRNLFNVNNVVNVYPITGKPDDDADRPQKEAYYTEEEWKRAVEIWQRYTKDPDNYGIPRIVRIGIWVKL